MTLVALASLFFWGFCAFSNSLQKVPRYVSYILGAHMGTTFFVEGVKIFFVRKWVKNGSRGGGVFDYLSLGEEGERGEKENFTQKRK